VLTKIESIQVTGSERSPHGYYVHERVNIDSELRKKQNALSLRLSKNPAKFYQLYQLLKYLYKSNGYINVIITDFPKYEMFYIEIMKNFS